MWVPSPSMFVGHHCFLLLLKYQPHVWGNLPICFVQECHEGITETTSILTPWVLISSIIFSRSCCCSHFSSESFNFILFSFTVSCNFTCEHAVNGALAFAGSVGLADFLFSSNLVHVLHFHTFLLVLLDCN